MKNNKFSIFTLILFISILLVGCSDGETDTKDTKEANTEKETSDTTKISSINAATNFAIKFEKDFAKAVNKEDYSIIEDYFMTEDNPDYEQLYWQIPSDELSSSDENSVAFQDDVRPSYYMSIGGLGVIEEDLDIEIEDVSLSEIFEYDDGYRVILDVDYIVNGKPKSDESDHYIYVDGDNNGYIVSPHYFVSLYTAPLDYWMSDGLINDYNKAIEAGSFNDLESVTVEGSEAYQEGKEAIESGESPELLSYYTVSTLELSKTEYKAVVVEFTPEGNKRFVEYLIAREDENFYPVAKKRTVIKEVPFDELSEYDKNIVKEDLEKAEIQVASQEELNEVQYEGLENTYEPSDDGVVPYSGLEQTVRNYIAAYLGKDIDSLANFVDPQSSFYKEQYRYMQSLNERHILLSGYVSLQDTKENEDGSYFVKTSESYTIETPGEADKDVEQDVTYTLKNIDGKLLITDMELE